MLFFLGTPQAAWLADSRFSGIPLFLSRRSLPRLRWPRALGPWALDSGGFTELELHGKWTLSARRYAFEVREAATEIGQLAWAAPQDWMCEPAMLRRTGLSVAEHQAKTLSNFLRLRDVAPDLPFIPVLQGWEPDDYLRHVDAYTAAGVDLRLERLVGVGTVCRRQGTTKIANLLFRLRAEGLRLHGFGVKAQGLRLARSALASADSHAWGMAAMYEPPLPGCAHKTCSSCPLFALAWRAKLLNAEKPPMPKHRGLSSGLLFR